MVELQVIPPNCRLRMVQSVQPQLWGLFLNHGTQGHMLQALGSIILNGFQLSDASYHWAMHDPVRRDTFYEHRVRMSLLPLNKCWSQRIIDYRRRDFITYTSDRPHISFQPHNLRYVARLKCCPWQHYCKIFVALNLSPNPSKHKS